MQELIRHSAEMGILLTEKDRVLFSSRTCKDRIQRYESLVQQCQTILDDSESTLSSFHKGNLRNSVTQMVNMINLFQKEVDKCESDSDTINQRIASTHQAMMDVCPHFHKDRWTGLNVSYDRCRACYQIIETPFEDTLSETLSDTPSNSS